MSERTWSHCPMCPDHVWKLTEEMVRLPKPVKVEGYITYYLCREHTKQLIKMAKQRQRKKHGR